MLAPPSTAGSSGTRIYVHSWTPGNALGTIRELTRRKLKPGLSAYVNSLDSVDEALTGLLDHAALFVPAESRAATSVFLKATAGLRLLTPTGRAAVLDRARDVLAGKEGRLGGREWGKEVWKVGFRGSTTRQGMVSYIEMLGDRKRQRHATGGTMGRDSKRQ